VFRYVPQIDELLRDGIDPRILALLVDRDRQLEDYLSNLPSGSVTVHRDTASSNATLTTSYADVPGCSVTFDVDEAATLVITGIFAFIDVAADTGWEQAFGIVLVDGSQPEANVHAYLREVTAMAGLPQGATAAVVTHASVSAGSHTVKLQAKKVGVGGTVDLSAPDTTLSIIAV
jgi:hypothetical protein